MTSERHPFVAVEPTQFDFHLSDSRLELCSIQYLKSKSSCNPRSFNNDKEEMCITDQDVEIAIPVDPGPVNVITSTLHSNLPRLS